MGNANTSTSSGRGHGARRGSSMGRRAWWGNWTGGHGAWWGSSIDLSTTMHYLHILLALCHTQTQATLTRRPPCGHCPCLTACHITLAHSAGHGRSALGTCPNLPPFYVPPAPAGRQGLETLSSGPDQIIYNQPGHQSSV
ncbi:hypothetical protein SKAU_G00112600 [Synaphobranchus kaupii]|uniref:Uncharacterized protein n=1 Tax=Synaphobranchus kaupii TaxID=118154 RepID=A0A9Q1G104_SYNKA|nr:hypothetical protein SKAU_G00112600 [Synaphobranchus kaupii]